MTGESGKRRARSLGVAFAVIGLAALVFVLGTGATFAWTDITDDEWVGTYGVTATQAATVAGGYEDGTFRPGLAVNRGQFAKMVVDGFALTKDSPATVTFSDVATSNYYSAWIEAAAAGDIISGYTDNTFRPGQAVTRQQANSMLGKYLAQKELEEKGYLQGNSATYASLDAWYTAEGAAILAQFADRSSVASAHAPAVAYLIYHGVTKGSQRSGGLYLSPGASLTRAQAVALILRVKGTDLDSSDSAGGAGGTPPTGTGGGTPPSGSGGAGGGSSAAVYPSKATFTLSGGTDTSDGETFTATVDDTSAILVTDGGAFTVTNAIIHTSGDTSSNDSSSFYGLNAAVIATKGSGIAMSDSEINTTGSGANGAFATGEGASVTLTGVTIIASGGGGHGVMATLGGAVTLKNVDITTSGANSAPLATDRGGGTITATGGTVVASGQDSPALYSTGVITVNGGTYTATGAEAAVIEGANSIVLHDVELASTVAGKWGVMIYQSMSGDAEGSEGTFTMTGGSLSYSGTTGPLFYVTNATADIDLTGVDTTAGSSGILVNAAAGNWGTSGSNGGNAVITAKGQDLAGNLVADAISTITLLLTDGSSLAGSINTSHTAKSIYVTLDASSTWTLTADCYVTGLTLTGGVSGTSIATIVGNGHTIYYDASDPASAELDGGTYTLSGGGTLQPLS